VNQTDRIGKRLYKTQGMQHQAIQGCNMIRAAATKVFSQRIGMRQLLQTKQMPDYAVSPNLAHCLEIAVARRQQQHEKLDEIDHADALTLSNGVPFESLVNGNRWPFSADREPEYIIGILKYFNISPIKHDSKGCPFKTPSA
jgi:hypothetical protein